jgi:hypothetical protein
MGKNVTKNQLEKIWEQLDTACGALDNATYALASMNKLPDDVKQSLERVDVSAIISLKNKIEELMQTRYFA